MFKFIESYKAKQKAEQERKGYDWAAGALLRGEETPMSIDAYTNGNDRTAFDFGADEACRKLISLGVVKLEDFQKVLYASDDRI